MLFSGPCICEVLDIPAPDGGSKLGVHQGSLEEDRVPILSLRV